MKLEMGFLRCGLKTLLFFIVLYCAAMLYAAKSDDLTAEDAGRLLYRNYDGKIFVFKNTTDKDLWHCTGFRENTSANLRPFDCTVLDQDEGSLTPEEVVVELIHAATVKYSYVRSRVFASIAKKMNSPLIDQFFSFELELNKLCSTISEYNRAITGGGDGSLSSIRRRSIAERENRLKAIAEKSPRRGKYFNPKSRFFRDKKTQGSNTCSSGANSSGSVSAEESAEVAQDLLQDELQLLFEGNPCVEMIRSMAGKSHNYFAAFGFFMKYHRMISGKLSGFNSNIRNAFNKEVAALWTSLLAEYKQHRLGNTKRENDFKVLCPNQHGAWKYASPLSANEMKKRMISFYEAYRKLNSLSAYSEFPKWGNAALEVLQMVANPDLERKLDTALGSYKKMQNP